MTQDTTPTRTWTLRFTAAAAMIMLIAAPATAQLGGAAGALGGLGGLPVAIPEAPDLPISTGAELPGISASTNGASAHACIDTDAARNAADDARSQAETLASPATSAAAPVTSQVESAKAQAESLASPVTSQLPDPESIDTGLQHCVDSDDPEGSATGAVEKAQGKAGGFVAQVKGAIGSLRSMLPF